MRSTSGTVRWINGAHRRRPCALERMRWGVLAVLFGRRWRIARGDEDAVLAMAAQHDIPQVLARILAARGVAQTTPRIISIRR